MSLHGRRDGVTIHMGGSRIGLIIFGIIWILVVSFAAYLVIKPKITINQGDYELTKSTVTECVSREVKKTDSNGDWYTETVYDVTVVYFVEGEEYSTILHGYSSYHPVGDKIELYYNKDNPEDTVNNISNSSIAISLVILIAFGLVGVGLIVFGIRGRRRPQEPIY